MFKRLLGNKLFLITALLLIMAFPAVTGATILNAATPSDGNFLHKKNANGIGLEAEKLGIKSYTTSDENGDKIVNYSGSLNGSLRMKFSNEKVLTLVNNDSKGSSSITWDLPNGKFTYTDKQNRTCTISLNFETKQWSEDSGSQYIIEENQRDIQLMGAIATDFDLIEKYKNDSQTNMSNSLKSGGVCPTYSYHVIGSDTNTSRSVACYNATAEANSECCNRYCIGCYQTLPCDCVCVPHCGDFFCYCQAYGIPCGPC